jgi:hypothetical protein
LVESLGGEGAGLPLQMAQPLHRAWRYVVPHFAGYGAAAAVVATVRVEVESILRHPSITSCVELLHFHKIRHDAAVIVALVAHWVSDEIVRASAAVDPVWH